MTLEEFQGTLSQDTPSQNWDAPLRALWWDAKGDWERAHETAQNVSGPDAAWVHAYLHRKEGDDWNAGFWYNRAGKEKSCDPLDDEWQDIVTSFLTSE